MSDLLRKKTHFLIRSFIMRDLSESLFCPERSERIALSRSFDVSNERMSKFPTLKEGNFLSYCRKMLSVL